MGDMIYILLDCDVNVPGLKIILQTLRKTQKFVSSWYII